METINEYLYTLFMDELHDLELGHGYNYKRLSRMRSIVSLFMYLRYAVLSENEIIRLLESYEQF